jgi:hypothetical protein
VLGFVDECRDDAGMVLMRETETKVQEARNALFVGDGGYPAFEKRLDALIAAVREDEREQAVGRVMTRTPIPKPDNAFDYASVLDAIRNA